MAAQPERYEPTRITRSHDDRGSGEQPSTHLPPLPPPQPRVTVIRVAIARTKELTSKATRKIIDASRASGAGETGLSKLLWNHATQTAGDAMIAVALAGTIFFSAATSEQRTQVALYLAITMAPFAIVAPVIGPILDRLQHGRRAALAATMCGRAVLAYIMAENFDNYALYPAAFGTLVLSRSYSVLRGACVPRLLPKGMTLVSANARLSFFGLALAVIAGAALAGFIRITDSYPWALRITMVVFLISAISALRLPKQVDSSRGEVAASFAPPTIGLLRNRRPLGRHVVIALRSTSALRGLAGFLTLFLAFLIHHEHQGTSGAIALGAVVAGASSGSFLGTAAGARFKLARPDNTVLMCVSSATGVCIIAALSFSIQVAVIVALIAGFSTSLCKLCLDSIIQREVPGSLQASAFARSETMLQLAWVFGGGLGIALPSNGRLGFAVASALMISALVMTIVGRRKLAISASRSGKATGLASSTPPQA